MVPGVRPNTATGQTVDVGHLLGEIWEFVWNAGDVAGFQDKVHDKHTHHLDTHKALLDTVNVLHRSVTTHLTLDNWNDAAGAAFQARWTEHKKAHDTVTGLFRDQAKALGDLADQIGYFNDNFHLTLVTIAVSIGVEAAAAWIPGVNLFTTAAGAIEIGVEVDRFWSLANLWRGILMGVRTLLQFVGRNLPSIVLNAGRSLRTSHLLIWGSRLFERGVMFGGDPTKGWNKYDFNQILVSDLMYVGLQAFLVGNLAGAQPYGPLGRFARLDGTWASFGRSVLSRIIQVGGLATVFNFTNQMVIQGKGLNFNARDTLWAGTGFSLITTSMVIVGSCIILRGRSTTTGLPQQVTIPVVLGLNSFADVGIPGLSPIVRNARGLIYESAATQVTPQEIKVIQNITGISPHFTSRTVGPNDTIYTIADQQYGEHNDATINDILKANHLNSVADVRPGQVLVMPSLQAGDY